MSRTSIRPAVALALLVALPGCRRESPRAACDRDALAKLGDRLAPLSIREQASQVWPGLEDACGRAIPPPIRAYFGPIHDPALRPPYLARERDPWRAAMQRTACPDWDELMRSGRIPAWSEDSAAATYEHCELARHGVFATDEVMGFSTAIMTWATHEWLLDQGLDGRVAAPITRALFALDQIHWSPIERYENLRLPKVHGVRFRPGAAVYVARDVVIVEARPTITLVDGRLTDNLSGMMALVEDLRELAERHAHEPDASFALVADARTPIATILRLLQIVDGLGYAGYGLVVESEAYVPTQVPVTLVRVEPNVAQDESIFMRIELGPESMTLSRIGVGGRQPEVHALTQTDAVYGYAQAIRSEDPEAHRVVVSAEGTVTLERALAVIEAARGPECGETGAGCVLPEVLLLIE